MVCALAPVLAGAPDLVPVPASDPDLNPCPQLVMSRPPRPPPLSWFVLRATMSFAVTVASSVVSLATVAVIFAMAMRLLAVAISKFTMASTVSCWRFLSFGFVVALCALP